MSVDEHDMRMPVDCRKADDLSEVSDRISSCYESDGMLSDCASNVDFDLDLQSLVREMDPDWMTICEVRMSTDPVTGAHSLTESDKPGHKEISWMTGVDKGPGTSVRRSGKFTLKKNNVCPELA